MRRILLVVVVIAGAVVLVVGGYLAFIVGDAAANGPTGRSYRNVTAAMEPTILRGDVFTVASVRGNKGQLMPVRRGEVVVHLWPPDTTKAFAKRLVGVPGDTLAMRDGVLYLDGRKLDEPYAWHSEPGVDPISEDFDWQRAFIVGDPARDTVAYHPSRNNWGPLVLPPGRYFVLGDNRDNSLDSRYFGFIPGDYIRSRTRRIYLSRDPASGTIRWNRLGARIE